MKTNPKEEGELSCLYFVLLMLSPCHEISKQLTGTICGLNAFCKGLLLSVPKVNDTKPTGA